MKRLEVGAHYFVYPGEHFTLTLPDGTTFNVEQTADDFSIVHNDGTVAYTTPTSAVAKDIDTNLPQITGRK